MKVTITTKSYTHVVKRTFRNGKVTYWTKSNLKFSKGINANPVMICFMLCSVRLFKQYLIIGYYITSCSHASSFRCIPLPHG